jgi:hypothetical protein
VAFCPLALLSHQTRLVAPANPYNPVFMQALDTLTQGVVAAGHPASDARVIALARLHAALPARQTFLASLDGFYFLAAVAIVGGMFAAWPRELD